MTNFIDSREAHNFEREYLDLIKNLSNLIKSYTPKSEDIKNSSLFLAKFINIFKDLAKNRYRAKNFVNKNLGIDSYPLKIKLDGECIFHSDRIGQKQPVKFAKPEKAPQYASRLKSALSKPESFDGSLTIEIGNKPILNIRNGVVRTDAFNLLPSLRKELGLSETFKNNRSFEPPKIDQLLNKIQEQTTSIDKLNQTISLLQQRYESLEKQVKYQGIGGLFRRISDGIGTTWENVKEQLEARRIDRIKNQVLTSGYKDYRNLENLFKGLTALNQPTLVGNEGFYSSYDPISKTITLGKLQDLETSVEQQISPEKPLHNNNKANHTEADLYDDLKDLFDLKNDPSEDLKSKSTIAKTLNIAEPLPNVSLNKGSSSPQVAHQDARGLSSPKYDRALEKKHLLKIQNLMSYLAVKKGSENYEFKDESYHFVLKKGKCSITNLKTSQLLVKDNQIRSDRPIPAKLTKFLESSPNYKPSDLHSRLEKLFLRSTKVQIGKKGIEIYNGKRYKITRDPKRPESLLVARKKDNLILCQNGRWKRDVPKTAIDNFYKFINNYEQTAILNKGRSNAQNIAQKNTKKKGRKL